MSVYNFTATQQTYNFTATVTNPANLTLAMTPDQVTITDVVTTITVINNVSPVSVSSGIGQFFNQNLNTTDNVQFATLTVPTIYGVAQQPVLFPTGLSAANFGTTYGSSLDLGTLGGVTLTNQIALIFAFLPIDFGTIGNPSLFAVNFGSV